VSIREDAYNDRAPQTDGRRFAENERGVRLGWLGALQNYTIDFDPAPRASLSLSLALPKGNRRAYPVSFYESVVMRRHGPKWRAKHDAVPKRIVFAQNAPTRDIDCSSSILGSAIEWAEIAKCCRRSVDAAKNRPSSDERRRGAVRTSFLVCTPPLLQPSADKRPCGGVPQNSSAINKRKVQVIGPVVPPSPPDRADEVD
jgi:hypothetical protein